MNCLAGQDVAVGGEGKKRKGDLKRLSDFSPLPWEYNGEDGWKHCFRYLPPRSHRRHGRVFKDLFSQLWHLLVFPAIEVWRRSRRSGRIVSTRHPFHPASLLS